MYGICQPLKSGVVAEHYYRKSRGITTQPEFGALKTGRGKHRKYAPYVFTEQGVAMLSSVLNSARAVQVNIEIMRAFVRLRETASTHKDLARKLSALESRYDSQFKVVFDAIRGLMKEPEPKRRGIGFTAKIDD
jgi:hypothetical protein